LVESVSKLRHPELSHDLRIPDGNAVERAYSTLSVEEDGFLNYNEFQTLVFQTTLENSD